MNEDSKKTVFRRVIVPEEDKKKFLVGNTPPYLGKPFEIPAGIDFTIGREEERTLQLASDMVSRLHAILRSEDGKCSLIDKGSSNGTFLNSEKIPEETSITLNHKDIVKFDTFEFIYVDTSCGDLWQTLKPLSREGSQIVSFYSPKGGTGITSIVVNLAGLLSKEGNKVVVVDLDLRFGDITAFVSGKPAVTINELIKEQEITSENIKKYLSKANGFDYLQAPKRTELAELISANHVKSILWSLQVDYDYVLVDLKSEIDDISITSWELSNLVYIVANPEVGHMLATKKIIEIMNKFKFPESKVKVLINKIGREGTIDEEGSRAFLKRDVVTLPYAPNDAVITSNQGKLIVEQTSGPLAKGYKNLQKIIVGEEVIKEEGGVFAKLKSILGL